MSAVACDRRLEPCQTFEQFLDAAYAPHFDELYEPDLEGVTRLGRVLELGLGLRKGSEEPEEIGFGKELGVCRHLVRREDRRLDQVRRTADLEHEQVANRRHQVACVITQVVAA